MKKNIRKILLLIFVMFLNVSVVKAASFSINVGSKSLTKGGSTKLTISGNDVTGRFNITSSDPSIISVSEDRAWIENDSYTINLSALKVGTATITITPSGVSDSNGNSTSLGAKSVQITVSLPREKSTDNNLKSLSVEGYEITPSFSKDVTDYQVTVQEGVTNIKINALANESHATVTGTGNIDIVQGINNLSIVVKSESGKDKVYTLVVNVIDQNPINVTVDDKTYSIVKLKDNFKCPELYTDKEIVIENIPIPACYNEKINYTLVGLKSEDGTIESFIYNNGKYEKYNELMGNSLRIVILEADDDLIGLKKTKSLINGTSYSAMTFENTSTSYIVYGLNVATGKKDYYIYDSINKTFALYDTKPLEELSKLNEIYLYVIIAFGIGLLLSLICIISLSKRKKKLNVKSEEENFNNEPSKKSKKAKKEKMDEEIKENIIKEDVNELKEIIANDSDIDDEYEEYDFLGNKKKKNKRKK